MCKQSWPVLFYRICFITHIVYQKMQKFTVSVYVGMQQTVKFSEDVCVPNVGLTLALTLGRTPIKKFLLRLWRRC